MKNSLTNWMAAISVSITTALGLTSALDLKIPPRVLYGLGAIAVAASAVGAFATGKNEDMSDPVKRV